MSFIPLPTFVMTITLGDILILLFLYALIKKIKIPPEELLKEIKKEATKLALMWKVANPAGAAIYLTAEVLLDLVKTGKISREEAKRILAEKIKKLRLK